MTNDYKETLLKYMTGKLENETGVNEPQFNKRNDINQNIISYLDEHLTDGWYYVGDTEGVCLDGWQQIDGTWYYFFKGYRWLDCYGVMAADEYVDGYYLTKSGAYNTGN